MFEQLMFLSLFFNLICVNGDPLGPTPLQLEKCSSNSTLDEQRLEDILVLKTTSWCKNAENVRANQTMKSFLIEKINRSEWEKQRIDFELCSSSIRLERIHVEHLIENNLVLRSNKTQISFPKFKKFQFDQSSVFINLQIHRNVPMLDLSFHDRNGGKIPVENLTDPIDIRIPNYETVSKPALFHINVANYGRTSPFIYHRIDLKHSENISLGLQMEFQTEDSTRSYLFLVRFHGKPLWKNRHFHFSTMFCPSLERSNRFNVFLDQNKIRDFQWAIVGIAELSACDEHLIDQSNGFSSNYSLRFSLSACSYFHEIYGWQSDGLLVGPATNSSSIQCLSTHLTKFAAGFFVLPEPIPFVELDFHPAKNITIYVTLIILVAVYVLLMIYSYFKDKKDAQMLLVMPLADNKKHHRYLYQLVVHTGMRAHSGTKSKVQFVISGDRDETQIRHLNATGKNILTRGSCDSFIMAVPKCLGPLSYLRIWHDNSGMNNDASWFLKYIVVRDLQTLETTYFICQDWLAVEKGSGQISRTLISASEAETKKLKYMLTKHAYHSIADNHLWFSIFAHHSPSEQRFTRIQRCTCCFVLLFLSLMMKILYFDTKKTLEKKNDEHHGLILGPIRISTEQIGIAVMTELIVFVPSLILISLYRRSRIRSSTKLSPLSEAIEKLTDRKLIVHPKASNVKKKFFLPWWCTIVAHVLSIVTILVSIVFTAMRAVQYGDQLVQEWLVCTILGIVFSIILIQPFKSLIIATFFICRYDKKHFSEVFIEEQDLIVDFTISKAETKRKFPANSILAQIYRDRKMSKYEKRQLEQWRMVRLKEVRSWFILRELFFTSLFLGCLYTICFTTQNIESSHQMVNYLRSQFLVRDYENEHKSTSVTKSEIYVFLNIRTSVEYWDWLEDHFLPRLAEIKPHFGVSPSKTSSQNNYILCCPSLRQVRVKKELKIRQKINENIVAAESLPYTKQNEETSSFGNLTDRSQPWASAFDFTPGKNLGTLLYSTGYATYRTGGFIYRFNTSRSSLIRKDLQSLRENQWIDQYTRAVFLNMDIYNPNIDLMVHSTLLIEKLPGVEQIFPYASFHPFRFHFQSYPIIEILSYFSFFLLIVHQIISEIRLLFENPKAYVRRFWSYVIWLFIISTFVLLFIRFYREKEILSLRRQLKENSSKQPINLQSFSYLSNTVTYLLSFCCFSKALQLTEILRFNSRMNFLTLTLSRAGPQLIGFLVMASIVFFAFVNLFYLLFHSLVEEFSTWGKTCESCLRMISSHLSTLNDLTVFNIIIAALCLPLFIFIGIFVLTSMFVSIISDNLNSVRHEQSTRNDEIDLFEYLTVKLKYYLAIFGIVKPKLEEKSLIERLPERFDRLASMVNENTMRLLK